MPDTTAAKKKKLEKENPPKENINPNPLYPTQENLRN
jgi:hypothetical protein